ncbi:MAG: type I DNA topoisomerase [Phycisphaeraceae bacterium]|nr:type I DNA topoisomerase [Phycisphaerales bacterium]MCB9860083.1 type I DNA topoisomerase [Phycisphaeraceae bacterium]
MARTASTKAPAKKQTTTKKVAARSTTRRSSGTGFTKGSAKGKHLVIVESPAKAKTINKYLGKDYIVLASVGHVRDLPSKAPKPPKGKKKSPVPGVDLEKKFTPTYQVLEGKEKVVNELKAASKEADDVWFATDLDREGEAIAWHLAQELKIDPTIAKRVIFPAITKAEIEKAFSNPHAIDIDRVNAQQARRIVDRIVGYQVSPLLWKKIARGLSAGRVQSVAVRLVVEREREIRAFIPDEYWQINANFALSESDAAKLIPQWQEYLRPKSTKDSSPTVKAQNEWLAKHNTVKAELVEVAGEKFDVRTLAKNIKDGQAAPDLTSTIKSIVESAGLTNVKSSVTEDQDGRGPARFLRSVSGDVDPSTPYSVTSIQTKQTSSRPSAPFITSSMQQAASTRLGFGAQRTMRAAQSLYEGVEIPGEGPVGLITYMRTDSTHIANEAIDMARSYIKRSFGDAYLPDKPNFYSSSNKAAQEAHEAIRPTSLDYPPEKIARALTADQLKLYTIIWERFVACQMKPAVWNSTSVFITGGTDPKRQLTFKASGRTLVFDGFYRVTGVPTASDEQTLPELKEKDPLHPFAIDPTQKFTSAPPRYSEASLIKMLESEGIGRPSTYASIISVIQDRKYVEQLERRFHATDLGEVVTDKLIEAFPRIMDVGYTREMEAELDKIEEDHLDWIDMLDRFYSPFKDALASAEENLTHAKAETTPAPYTCEKCGAPTVYRFGRNGRFLSCSTYPECNYASPIDRNGKPRTAEFVNVRCPKTGRPMVRRTGRFGPFLTTVLADGESNDIGMILNIDKKGHVTAPSVPPLETDLPCPTCESPLNLRDGARGPWLGCSRFPKCRGRGKWAGLEDSVREDLEKQLDRHKAKHPIPIITTLDGKALTDANGKPVKDAPMVDQLVLEDEPAWQHEETAA